VSSHCRETKAILGEYEPLAMEKRMDDDWYKLITVVLMIISLLTMIILA
jgi:hypothetical protein